MYGCSLKGNAHNEITCLNDDIIQSFFKFFSNAFIKALLNLQKHHPALYIPILPTSVCSFLHDLRRKELFNRFLTT